MDSVASITAHPDVNVSEKEIETEFDNIKCCRRECAENKCEKITEGMISEKRIVSNDEVKTNDAMESHTNDKDNIEENGAENNIKESTSSNETSNDKFDSIEIFSDNKSKKDEEAEKKDHAYAPYNHNGVVLRKTIDTNRKSQVPVYDYMNDGPELKLQRKSTVMKTTENRKNEKSNLQNLNSRLATFIEKVRYLEAYNKALMDEIEKLRSSKASNGLKLREIYEKELEHSRKSIDEAQGQLSSADVSILGLEENVRDSSQTINDKKVLMENLKRNNNGLVIKVGDYQGEVTRLSDQCAQYDNELTTNRDLIRRLQDSDITTKADLDAETIKHLDAENRAHNMENQLTFVTEVYEQEIIELKGLLNERRGDTEVKEYWQGELRKAVGDIQADYDERLRYLTDDMRQKLALQVRTIRETAAMSESSIPYLKEELGRQKSKFSGQSLQIMDLQSENVRLRANVDTLTRQIDDVNKEMDSDETRMQEEITRLQNELEVILNELQTLMNAKVSMQMEIATYTKLLEHEEIRVTEPSQKKTVREKPSVGAPELTEQKDAVGEIMFGEAPPDGRYVSVKNKTRDARAKPLLLKGWSICRKNSVGKYITYTFGDVKIAPLETIKVWGKGQSRSRIPYLKDGLVADFDSWGTGNSETYLYNGDKQEKANISLMFK